MGVTNSHLNINTLSSIIQAKEVDIVNIIRLYEGRKVLSNQPIYKSKLSQQRLKEIKNEAKKIKYNQIRRQMIIDNDLDDDTDIHIEISDSETDEKTDNEIVKELNKFSYLISYKKFIELLDNQKLSIHSSDKEILCQMFTLVNQYDNDSIDLRDVIIGFIPLLTNDVKQSLSLSISLYDRQDTKMIEKNKLKYILTILNNSFDYFNDKPLQSIQINDLVDSIYTSAGKIDGYIYYKEYIDLIVNHPITVILLSIQYQQSNRINS